MKDYMNIFTPVKNRSLSFRDSVRVYRNLHKKCYSIQKKIDDRWLVVAHTDKLMLYRCKFVVNENGRQKVLNTKRKNVHAFVYGILTDSGMGLSYLDERKLPATIKYNPYKNNQFYCDNLTLKSFNISGAACVKFDESGLSGAYLDGY